MNLERLYLDYNATSPLSRSVLDWLKSGDVLFANPASQHTDGKHSRKVINEARAYVFQLFGKSENDTQLIFTSGATEAFITYAYSFAEMARRSGKELLVCFSRIDHPAVTALSERYWGPHVKFHELKINKDLTYAHEENFQFLLDKKENNPDLIVLYHHLWVHNETGLVAPLNEMEKLKRIPDLYLHVDCVQAPGKVPDWRSLTSGDIWSFSAHKFGALKGIGFSFMRKNIPFYPFISGGGQQQGMRSGTENPQGVKSIMLALTDLEKVNVDENKRLRDEFEGHLEKELEGLGGIVKGRLQNANTIYFYFHKVTSDVALALFDLNGLEISAGSACSSGAAKASTVLLQMGLSEVAKNGLRLSWTFEMTLQKVSELKGRMAPVLERIRAFSK